MDAFLLGLPLDKVPDETVILPEAPLPVPALDDGVKDVATLLLDCLTES